MEKYICIHGHFYQPPRENPWLEKIELQDSAYPYHDWNQRVTAECYEPNTAARVLGPDLKIIDIINNYSKISFNFDSEARIRVPFPEGRWVKALDSAEEHWKGPGSALPAAAACPATAVMRELSFALYIKAASEN